MTIGEIKSPVRKDCYIWQVYIAMIFPSFSKGFMTICLNNCLFGKGNTQTLEALLDTESKLTKILKDLEYHYAFHVRIET